jgi:hypothetical protein
MTLRRLPALALLLGLPMATLAQAPAPAPVDPARSGYQEIRDDRRVIEPFNLTVDQLDDLDVVTASGERLGEVEEVLMDAAGRPVAVTVELRGGDDRDRIIRLDQLRLDGRRLVTGLSRAQVEALPVWDD